MDNQDLVLQSFLATARDKKISLPEEILIKIYNIEKNHQFSDRDNRAAPCREIEKTINQFITGSGE
jgi:hypothetical protein